MRCRPDDPLYRKALVRHSISDKVRVCQEGKRAEVIASTSRHNLAYAYQSASPHVVTDSGHAGDGLRDELVSRRRFCAEWLCAGGCWGSADSAVRSGSSPRTRCSSPRAFFMAVDEVLSGSFQP
jgi:hypothetical protein